MQRISAFFVRAKHWQIFLLIVGVGWGGGGVAMFLASTRTRSPEELLRADLPFEIVMVLSVIFFITWLWSMGSVLNLVAQPELRMRQRFFRFANGYAVAYMFVFFAAFNSANPVFVLVFIPLHLFAFFCMFYDLYFVSESLALAETRKPVFFPDYAGEFFLLWFFPIGIWFIQPKINRLCGSARESVSASEAVAAARISAYVDENQTASSVYAGFWRRFAAMLIDGAIISFPVYILFFFAFVVLWRLTAASGGAASVAVFTVLLVGMLVVPWLYFSLLESSRWQATVGKSALRVYVADVQGRRLSRGRSMARNLAKFVSTVTLGVGYLMCAFTARKQALHDIIARSVVLRRSSATKFSPKSR